MGIVAFIIPFMFVYAPSLLMQGSFRDIFFAAVTAVVGVLALAAGFEGWFGKKLAVWEQMVLSAAGLLSIYPGTWSSIIGLAGIVAVLAPKLPDYIRDAKQAEWAGTGKNGTMRL